MENSKRKARAGRPPQAIIFHISLQMANLTHTDSIRIRHRIPQTDAFAFMLVNASVGETRVLIALEVQHRHIHQRVVEEAQGDEQLEVLQGQARHPLEEVGLQLLNHFSERPKLRSAMVFITASKTSWLFSRLLSVALSTCTKQGTLPPASQECGRVTGEGKFQHLYGVDEAKVPTIGDYRSCPLDGGVGVNLSINHSPRTALLVVLVPSGNFSCSDVHQCGSRFHSAKVGILSKVTTVPSASANRSHGVGM